MGKFHSYDEPDDFESLGTFHHNEDDRAFNAPAKPPTDAAVSKLADEIIAVVLSEPDSSHRWITHAKVIELLRGSR